MRLNKRLMAKIKRTLAVWLAATLCAGVYYALFNADAFISKLKNMTLFEWRADKISVVGEEGDIGRKAAELIAFKAGDIITARGAVAAQKAALDALKPLESVKARRRLFSKELEVRIKRKPVLAKIREEDGLYFASADGEVFSDEPLRRYARLPTVRLKNRKSGEALSQKIVKLLRELGAEGNVKADEAELDTKTDSLSLVTDCGVKVKMGDLSDIPEKMRALGLVVKQADKRGLKRPYKINMKYYKKGKIYLKSA